MTNEGFELNKIAGALLLAGFIALSSGLISEALYHGTISEHHGEEEKRGFEIEVTEETGGAPAEAEAAAPVDILPLLAQADPGAGEKLLKKCTACHTFDKGGRNGVGPNQWNLVGSHFAHTDGFSYSQALLAMKDRKWGFQELSDFLTNPKKYIPGNKMAFAGIKNPQERANLIAYLNTLSDKPLPLP